jgi:hypothetical protein
MSMIHLLILAVHVNGLETDPEITARVAALSKKRGNLGGPIGTRSSSDHLRRPTPWLGWEDSNSQTSFSGSR